LYSADCLRRKPPQQWGFPRVVRGPCNAHPLAAHQIQTPRATRISL